MEQTSKNFQILSDIDVDNKSNYHTKNRFNCIVMAHGLSEFPKLRPLSCNILNVTTALLIA